MLKRARNAEPRDVVRRAAGDIVALEADGAGAAIDAADAIEDAGLACAVRPDQREQFAGLDRKRHIIEHGQPAKAQAQMLHRQLSHTTSAIGDIA